MSLLDKAQAKRLLNPLPREKYSAEHDELLMAWARGEIRDTEAAHALDKKSNNIFHIMSCILRDGVRRGRLKLEQVHGQAASSD